MSDAIDTPTMPATGHESPAANLHSNAEYILTLSCPDKRGIVHAVSGFLTERHCNIIDSAQYGDTLTGTFFMRVHFQAENGHRENLPDEFTSLALHYDMDWQLKSAAEKPRLLIMVSRLGHCLNDLLYRYRSGLLHAEIAGVVSNHRDFESLVRAHDIPFYHCPITPATRAEQESKLLALVQSESIDLVVLARYMQILSAELSRALKGRAINIHHSFLPSFKGARPYAQAHARGVKLIGATAHFVTDDLDEGPIIEQDVVRVNHSMSVDAVTAIGRDVESVVLARAVNWFLHRRILQNGDKTVVFN